MWFKYLLIILFTMGILSSIATIGNEREPITKGQAAFNTLINGLLIVGCLFLL